VKERPILFSTPMVNAILAGRKTQTRRLVKPQPVEPCAGFVTCDDGVTWMDYMLNDRCDATDLRSEYVCPYGVPGDQLYVRERLFLDIDRGWQYADTSPLQIPAESRELAEHWMTARLAKQRSVPSIHMPRWASRILLEVVSVRVERLQDISEADAIAEGVDDIDGERIDSERWIKASVLALDGPSKHRGHSFVQRHRAAFWDLWESINGEGSWKANPWVWVVEFKRVTP